MNPRAKRTISIVLRLAVCVAAAFYLYRKVSWNDRARLPGHPEKWYRVTETGAGDALQLRSAPGDAPILMSRAEFTALQAKSKVRLYEPGLHSIIRQMRGYWALAGMLALAPTTFLMAWRLKYLLTMQNIHLTMKEATLLSFGGNFYNFALPLGTTAGDVYKAYHVARRAPRRTEAVTIVLLDRAIGFVNYILLAGFAILFSWKRNAIGRLGQLVGLMLLLTVVGALIFFSKRFRKWVGYEALLRRLPMAERLRRIDQTAFSMRYHPRQTIVALVVTTINNGFLALMMWCFGRALGMPPGEAILSWARGAEFYLANLLALSVGFLAAAVPISVQGFGLLEAVFFRVLGGGLWGGNSQVLALAIASRLGQLVWALPGIAVLFLPHFEAHSQSTEGDEASIEPSPVDKKTAGTGPRL